MRCWSFLQLLTDIPDATIGVLVGIGAGLLLEELWSEAGGCFLYVYVWIYVHMSQEIRVLCEILYVHT